MEGKMPKSNPDKSLKSAAKPTEPKKPRYFLWFFGFWGIVLILVIIAIAAFKLDPIALLVWFAVVMLSFIFMMAQLLSNWEGTVQEIRTIAERKKSGDSWVTKNVTYAFVKQPNGSIKKVRSGGWKVGDRLKKEKWEMNVKVL
jgi:hypothetical protein